MSDRGVFAVDRGVFEHAFFKHEPFTEREAWLWLIGEARWKRQRVRIGHELIDIERGQLVHSERHMATTWQWSKSRVHRFLLLLKNEAMVVINSDHETNRITICNYEKYAFDGTSKRTSSEPQTGPAADQPRTKDKEGKKERTKEEKVHAPSAPEPQFEFVEEPADEPPKAKLFRKGKTILVSLGLSEQRSGSVIGSWLKKRDDPTGILAALEYAVDNNVIEPVGYVTKLLGEKGKSNGKQHPADIAKQLADEARELERQAGIGRPVTAV